MERNSTQRFSSSSKNGSRKKYVAIDTETTGLNPWKGARPFAVGFYFGSGEPEVYEFPVDVTTRKVQIDSSSDAFKRIVEICASTEYEKLFYNIIFDWRMLEFISVPLLGKIHDVNLMAKCCNSMEPSYKLKELCKKYLGIDNDDERDLIEEVKHYRNLSKKMGIMQGDSLHEDYWLPKTLGSTKNNNAKYLAKDVIRTYDLAMFYFDAMKSLNVKHSYNKEMQLIPIMKRIEDRGVRLDHEKAYKKVAECENKQHELKRQIYQEIGTDKINIQSGKQLQKLLFEDRGLVPIKFTDSGQASTDVDHLSSFEDDFVCQRIIEHSGLKTGIGYLKNYLECKVPDAIKTIEDLPTWNVYCIHTNYHQFGASTNRFTSNNPNLQNISNPKTSSGREVVNCREVFKVRPGYVWYVFDYKQLELRIFADRSGEPKLIKAFEDGRDPHDETRRNVPYLAGLSPEVGRKLAKNTNFTTVNGGSWGVLVSKYGVPPNEAKAAMKGFHQVYTGAKLHIERLARFGTEHGYILNAYNRKLNIDVARAYNTATGTDIQGSAADLIKRAMINIDAYIQDTGYDAHLLLQVHDELVIEVNKKHAYKKFIRNIKDIMEDHGGVFSIPTPVDTAKTTTNWFEKHEIEL